jgi:hypothetical protein
VPCSLVKFKDVSEILATTNFDVVLHGAKPHSILAAVRKPFVAKYYAK